jgi:hypothetical protein
MQSRFIFLKSTGTWIMNAGTPYARLMINGKP